jgi:homospermidine synthase
MAHHPRHASIAGPIVMIGFGSIGRGTLPLIDRHFGFDRSRLTVIDPADVDQEEIANYGGKFLKLALTRDN